jgi:hypothetical protein
MYNYLMLHLLNFASSKFNLKLNIRTCTNSMLNSQHPYFLLSTTSHDSTCH